MTHSDAARLAAPGKRRLALLHDEPSWGAHMVTCRLSRHAREWPGCLGPLQVRVCRCLKRLGTATFTQLEAATSGSRGGVCRALRSLLRSRVVARSKRIYSLTKGEP
jgi:hypothetical protein